MNAPLVSTFFLLLSTALFADSKYYHYLDPKSKEPLSGPPPAGYIDMGSKEYMNFKADANLFQDARLIHQRKVALSEVTKKLDAESQKRLAQIYQMQYRTSIWSDPNIRK